MKLLQWWGYSTWVWGNGDMVITTIWIIDGREIAQ